MLFTIFLDTIYRVFLVIFLYFEMSNKITKYKMLHLLLFLIHRSIMKNKHINNKKRRRKKSHVCNLLTHSLLRNFAFETLNNETEKLAGWINLAHELQNSPHIPSHIVFRIATLKIFIKRKYFFFSIMCPNSFLREHGTDSSSEIY